MIGPAGPLVQQARAAGLGLRIPDTPRCGKCGGPVHVDGYVVTRPEYGRCQECGAEWEDLTERGPLCRYCGYSLVEDSEGRGGCLPDGPSDPDERKARGLL